MTDQQASVVGDGSHIATKLDRIELVRRRHSCFGPGTVEYEFTDPWYQAEVAGYAGDVLRRRRLLRSTVV